MTIRTIRRITFIALAALAAPVLTAPPSPSSPLKVSVVFSQQKRKNVADSLFVQTRSRPATSSASSRNRISRSTLDFRRWAASAAAAAAAAAVMAAAAAEVAVVEAEAQVRLPCSATYRFGRPLTDARLLRPERCTDPKQPLVEDKVRHNRGFHTWIWRLAPSYGLSMAFQDTTAVRCLLRHSIDRRLLRHSIDRQSTLAFISR